MGTGVRFGQAEQQRYFGLVIILGHRGDVLGAGLHHVDIRAQGALVVEPAPAVAQAHAGGETRQPRAPGGLGGDQISLPQGVVIQVFVVVTGPGQAGVPVGGRVPVQRQLLAGALSAKQQLRGFIAAGLPLIRPHPAPAGPGLTAQRDPQLGIVEAEQTALADPETGVQMRPLAGHFQPVALFVLIDRQQTAVVTGETALPQIQVQTPAFS